MGRPRHEDGREATPDRILASALAVFARDGYAKSRLADIARGAAVTRPSLLYHFASKQALYEAVVRRSFERLGGALEAAMRGSAPFPERLRRLAGAFAHELATHPEDASIVVGELTTGDGPGRTILVEQVRPLLDGVVGFVEREGRGHVRPGLDVRGAVLQVAADVLLQSATRAELRTALWGPTSPERTASLAATLFLLEDH